MRRLRASRISAGVPTASTRPACISEMRSQRSASFMKWVETKMVTPSLPRQVAQMAPEHVARRRVHAGGRLVQDQHFGPVQAGCRQLQALADAERQSCAGVASATAARSNRSSASRARGADLLGRDAVQPRVQLQVGADRQFLVQARRPATCSRRACGFRCRRRPTGRPSSSARPSVAGSRPVSIFIVVVLPQPLEPRKPKISPRSIRKLT